MIPGPSFLGQNLQNVGSQNLSQGATTPFFGQPSTSSTASSFMKSSQFSNGTQSSSLFGGTQPAARNQPSMFGGISPQQNSTFNAPSSGSIFGTSQPTSFLNAPNTLSQPNLGSMSTSDMAIVSSNASGEGQMQIHPEVQKILERLNNADFRSCQVLTDTFKRLKTLVTEPPQFIAFTYGISSNPQEAQSRRLMLEHSLAALNHPEVNKAYRQAKMRNPEASKYYIIPIRGFEGMIEHVKQQRAHLETIDTRLQEIKVGQETMKNHLEIRSFKRYHDIIKRQRQLMLNVMKSAGLVESFVSKQFIAQMDIPFLKKLQNDLLTSVDEFQNSLAGNIALSKSTSQLTHILKTAISSSKDVTGQPLAALINEFILKRQEQNRNQSQRVSTYDLSLIQKILSQFDTLFEGLEMSIHVHSTKAKRFLELVETSNTADINTKI